MSQFNNLSPDEKQEFLKLLEQKQKLKDENKLRFYKPYPVQRKFHNSTSRERLFMAGNQIGKTFCSANEIAYHLTGLYPAWWIGRKFDAPTVGWAAGVTGESTRDTLQRLLLGRTGQLGTGAIPAKLIESVSSGRGVADSVDTVMIRHKGGGLSQLSFKSYQTGREKWQGETLHFVAFDEEPPMDIYTEGLTRTNATQGITWITFTPLLGMSSVVKRFLIDKIPNCDVVKASIEDAKHYSKEQRDAIIQSYPEHEREARAKGIPSLGSGKVFPVAESVIKVEPFPIPNHWSRICGIDFGWDHPTAAVWLAWDRDADTIYVYDTYRVRKESVAVHAAALRSKGEWIPVSFPHDGLQHDKGSGIQLAKQYKDQGLNMLPDRAKFEDGSSGVEAGISEMLTRMQTGRFRVFSHLSNWWEEFHMFHRKNGLIVKINDDLLAATRYAVMMRRKAKTSEESNFGANRSNRLPVVKFDVIDPVVGY
nr:DNA packaging protein [Burkholderiaceae bacterium]